MVEAAKALEPSEAVLLRKHAEPRAIDARLTGHLVALDGVRGLAITMVLLLHFVANTEMTNALERAAGQVLIYGVLGVDLFFVLSGFLITGILIDSKGSEHYFRNFYARRAVRIFPLYYGVLALVFLVAPLVPALAGPELDLLRREQAWAWLYGVNILVALHGKFDFPFLDHFWSLAVEEHFYFFWPLVVWACPRRILVWVAATICVLSLAGRVACSSYVNPVALYVLTPFRLDALCLGGFVAAYSRGPDGLAKLSRALTPVALATAVLLAATYAAVKINPRHAEAVYQLRPTLFATLFGALVVGALTAPQSPVLARLLGAPMKVLGKYSYGLYVFHHFISYYFVHHHTEFMIAGWVHSHTLAVLIQATFGIGLSFAVAYASYHLFEKHFLALKRLWQPRRLAASGPMARDPRRMDR
jgi:peptidoglycan/LPS O-acetylase OafA/YrhL